MNIWVFFSTLCTFVYQLIFILKQKDLFCFMGYHIKSVVEMFYHTIMFIEGLPPFMYIDFVLP